MNRVFLAGDTHAGEAGDLTKLNRLEQTHGEDLTKDDYVIILGDTGFMWDNSDRIHRLLAWFDKKPWTTLFIHGNHDNIPKLNKLKTIEKFGGEVAALSPSLFYLKNGNIYTIGEKTFFVMGGGLSIDKARRREGVSWWPEEIPSAIDYAKSFDKLERAGHKVDYMLSHTCSTSEFEDIANSALNRIDKSIPGEESIRNFLESIMLTTEYKKHYYGHFHLDVDFGKHQTIYDNLVML